MARRLSRSRHLATAARWPAGVALTSWRYMWRTTPMSRDEAEGDPQRDCAPPLPPGCDDPDAQHSSSGAGPLYHRTYRTRIAGSQLSSRALIQALKQDIDAFAPSEFASFQKVEEGTPMTAGEEYVVRMPGPWDGPVRAVEVTPTSFRLMTLAGHLEAGQIEFRAEEDDEEQLVFTIESWARSADRLTDVLYRHMRMSKEVQLHMWTSVLERVIDRTEGRRVGCIEISTRVLPETANA